MWRGCLISHYTSATNIFHELLNVYLTAFFIPFHILFLCDWLPVTRAERLFFVHFLTHSNITYTYTLTKKWGKGRSYRRTFCQKCQKKNIYRANSISLLKIGMRSIRKNLTSQISKLWKCFPFFLLFLFFWEKTRGNTEKGCSVRTA